MECIYTLSLFQPEMLHLHTINFCMYFHMVIDYLTFSNFLSGAVDYLCRVFATALWCSLYQGYSYQGYPWHMLSRACLPSNNNTSTETNIDHSACLVLHTAEVHLCSNLCLDNWKLLGFRHYIFLSKLVDSFFVCHTLWTVQSLKLCTHTTLFCNCSGRN